MNIEQKIMNIIVYSGEARSLAYEALKKSKEGCYDDAEELMKKANDAIGEAHTIQTELLQSEAAGEEFKVSILFVHAQDHLMTSISEKNLILEMIDLVKIVNSTLKNN